MTITEASNVSSVAAPATDARARKLVEASTQFEAMMLGELLKPLQFGGSPDEGGAEQSGAGAGDTIRGMANDALCRALSQHGGIGIARTVLKQVEAEALKARHEAVKQNETGAKVF